MNFQYIHCLLSKDKNKIKSGFTLIELLVVITLISILSAVALPSLLGQVGKARESEAKTTVGSVNRGQQAFHFETSTFAHNTNLELANNELGVVITPKFYGFIVTGTASDTEVTATATTPSEDAVRNYAGGVSYAAGAYTTAVCQSETIGGAATASGAFCTAGKELK